jgi:hypothetical protein
LVVQIWTHLEHRAAGASHPEGIRAIQIPKPLQFGGRQLAAGHILGKLAGRVVPKLIMNPLPLPNLCVCGKNNFEQADQRQKRSVNE